MGKDEERGGETGNDSCIPPAMIITIDSATGVYGQDLNKKGLVLYAIFAHRSTHQVVVVVVSRKLARATQPNPKVCNNFNNVYNMVQCLSFFLSLLLARSLIEIQQVVFEQLRKQQGNG